MTAEGTTKRRRKPSLAGALKDAREAGMTVKGVALEPDGRIVLSFGEREANKVNEGDNDLDRELEAFERQHDES